MHSSSSSPEMADTTNNSAKKRYAVVTGSNKGIGFEICKQLASKGIIVVLTARNEKRGNEAVNQLSEFGLSDHVVFHPLDVMDPASIASLADFVKTQFGKLDILVNNAGTLGALTDADTFKAVDAFVLGGAQLNWNELITESYELTKECLETNYYGAKRTTEALIPLLQLSDSPRIVNVSSSLGMLKNIPSDWAKDMLSDVENLTEGRVDEVLSEFLKDFKEGTLESKGWPRPLSVYVVSKAAINAYTRILAKKYPDVCINSVCPGFCKTDLNRNTGIFTADDGAENPVRMALLPDGGPSGLFFNRKEESPF